MIKAWKVGQNKRMKSLKSKKIDFIVGVIIGTIIFITIYGIDILNVANDSWIMNGGVDFKQHYLGWRFYRNSEWTFPIGMSNGFLYPNEMSIIYTDSIPIIALIFKVLSPLLPKTFQYMGVYGLLCFALQGGLSCIILSKFINRYKAFIGTIFFIISSVLFQRMYYHTALGSQWLILLYISIWIYKNNFKSFKSQCIISILLPILGISIHFHLFAICSVIFAGYLLNLFFENYNLKQTIILLFIYIGTAIFIMYILGGFTSEILPTADGLGIYSANLNTLFNSFNYTLFTKALPVYGEGQYEGYAYLGLGIIILFFIMLSYCIIPVHFKELWMKYKNEMLSIFITGIILYILALSPIITLNNWKIELSIPKVLKEYWGIFRSTGRFIWPVMYGVMIFSIIFVDKILEKRTGFILFIIVAIIQIVDMFPVIKENYKKYHQEYDYTCDLQSSIWENLALDYQHVEFMFNYSFNDIYLKKWPQIFSYGYYAVNHNMTISNFHFSRSVEEKVQNIIDKDRKELLNGNVKGDTIYVFEKDNFNQEYYKKSNLYFYEIDNELIGIKYPIIEQ